VLLVLLALVGVFATYIAAQQMMGRQNGLRVAVSLAVPKRAAPVLAAPETPVPPPSAGSKAVFPENRAGGAKASRAYEETLPNEVYEPGPAGSARPSDGTPRGAPAKGTPGQAAPGAATRSDLPPWRRYAVAGEQADGRPRIALVIDDMGVDRKRSARVIALPGPLTLAFLAYAEDLPRQTAAARAGGHELLLHVGMEPGNARLDPGPNVLLTSQSADEISRRLDWDFARFGRYVGINNHMGSKFTADAAAMRVVLEEVRDRGLLFLDSRTSSRTVAGRIARELAIPFAQRNIFIDNDNDVDSVMARLAEAERVARRKGFAVAIGHPREGALGALEVWLSELGSRGVQLVPLTAVVASGRAAG